MVKKNKFFYAAEDALAKNKKKGESEDPPVSLMN